MFAVDMLEVGNGMSIVEDESHVRFISASHASAHPFRFMPHLNLYLNLNLNSNLNYNFVI